MTVGYMLYTLYGHVMTLIQGVGHLWEFIFTPFYIPMRIILDIPIPLVVPTFHVLNLGPIYLPSFSIAVNFRYIPVVIPIPTAVSNTFNTSFLGGLNFGLLFSTPTLATLFMLKFVKEYLPFL